MICPCCGRELPTAGALTTLAVLGVVVPLPIELAIREGFCSPVCRAKHAREGRAR